MRTMVATDRQHQEEIQFRLILAATYPFFLAAAALNRFRPAREAARAWRRRAGPSSARPAPWRSRPSPSPSWAERPDPDASVR